MWTLWNMSKLHKFHKVFVELRCRWKQASNIYVNTSVNYMSSLETIPPGSNSLPLLTVINYTDLISQEATYIVLNTTNECRIRLTARNRNAITALCKICWNKLNTSILNIQFQFICLNFTCNHCLYLTCILTICLIYFVNYVCCLNSLRAVQ